MPYALDRSARLYYDDSCGPCRFLARAAETVSRQRVVATPLEDRAADRDLRQLSAEARFGYAHLAGRGELRTGEELVVPLVGLALGPTWERVVRRVGPVDRALRWGYVRLWQYRRTKGCVAASSR